MVKRLAMIAMGALALTAGCRSDLYQGEIEGVGARALAPNGRTPLYNADVAIEDVKHESYYAKTKTDADGFFSFPSVPDDSYRVTLNSANGVLTGSYEITVLDGHTPANVEVLMRPARNNEFINVIGRYDDMGRILADLGYVYASVQAETLAQTPNPLKGTDVVCLNSGVNAGLIENADAVANLREFVNDGGRLLVSDAAWPFVRASFPDAVTWPAQPDVGKGGQTLNADVSEQNYRDCLVVADAKVRYDLGGWAIPTATRGAVFLRGDAATINGTQNDAPLLLGFGYGEGYVVFATFNWQTQLGQGWTAVRSLNYFLANR